MTKTIQLLTETINRTSPNISAVKRAHLICKTLDRIELRLRLQLVNRKAAIRAKVVRGIFFACSNRPSEERDYRNMVSYSMLSNCFI